MPHPGDPESCYGTAGPLLRRREDAYLIAQLQQAFPGIRSKALNALMDAVHADGSQKIDGCLNAFPEAKALGAPVIPVSRCRIFGRLDRLRRHIPDACIAA